MTDTTWLTSRPKILQRMTERLEFEGPSASRRSVVLAAACLFGGLVIGGGSAAHTADTGSDTGTVAKHPRVAPVFPLTVTPGERHLEDANGRPFLIHGDTAWSLIAELTREDVELYLDDRRARGFNTLLVNLIENRFARNAPANAYGELPFEGQPVDYRRPDEAYFAHADWVLRQAAEKGFLVLLTPSYLGWEGGSQGWYEAMIANGPERLRQYGEFLGRRYRDFPNILWTHGGDYNPPRKDLVRAIAEGIATSDPRALHTAHTAPETAPIEYWEGEAWLQVNNVYTYGPVYDPALEQYARDERMPFFLMESAYENEHEATERSLRTQAYHAVLSGAAGQVFGNNPIWHFDSGGIYAAPVTWQQALDSRGAHSMAHLHDLLAIVPWWLLQPDSDHALLTDGLGSDDDRAVAALAVDRSLAVLYLPDSREVTVDLAQLAGPDVAARWYDPADGRFSAVGGSPFQASGPRRFNPEADNSSGDEDWVLVLESPS